jgi:hypothetical protein
MAVPTWPAVRFGPTGRQIRTVVELLVGPASGYYITSALRRDDPGSHHSGLTHHGSATAAVDVGFGYGTPGASARARALATRLHAEPGQVVELIVSKVGSRHSNGGYYVKNQVRTGAYAHTGPTTSVRHEDHIHLAMSAAMAGWWLARLQPDAPGSGYNPAASPIFGWDASDYDHARGMTLATVDRARDEGIRFFTHKLTEGTRFVHTAGRYLRRAADCGIPFVGPYVVPRTPGNGGNGSIREQADYFLAALGDQWPEWRSFPGFFLQIDTEKWSAGGSVYDAVAPRYGVELAEILRRRTGRQALGSTVHYAPRWAYGDSITGAEPLWASHYGENRPGGFRELYQAAGGDRHPGWAKYSGRTPAILQYGSRAVIGGQHTCDANAFRGTEADFAGMIGAGARPATGPGKKEESAVAAIRGDEQEVLDKIANAAAAAVWGRRKRGTVEATDQSSDGTWKSYPMDHYLRYARDHAYRGRMDSKQRDAARDRALAELVGEIAGLRSLVMELAGAGYALTPAQVEVLTERVTAAAREPGERILSALEAGLRLSEEG